MRGLSVPVYNNNVDMALRKLKRKIKDSNILFEIKKRTFYEKPSRTKREKKNLAILRNKYFQEKE